MSTGFRHLSAQRRRHIATADIASLDIEERAIRRQYDAMTVTHRKGCSIVRYARTGNRNCLYAVYPGRLGQTRLFFDPPTPIGTICRSIMYSGMWMRDNEPERGYDTAEEALEALLDSRKGE